MKALDWNISDRIALVTGGSRGIGSAVSTMLAEAGAHVVINFQKAEEKARSTARRIEELGGSCELKPFDVARLDQVQQACQEILDAHGRIDILVNNSGITRDQLFVRMKPQDWHEVIDVNLTGAYYCSRTVTRPMMRNRQGCIINMTSVAGLAGNAGQVNYSASKAGLIGLTKALAKELAAWNIRVNAVSPGYVVTDMTANLPDGVKEEIQGLIPLKRLGKPEDVARVVLFLASPFSDYITGQVISVNGGLYM